MTDRCYIQSAIGLSTQKNKNSARNNRNYVV